MKIFAIAALIGFASACTSTQCVSNMCTNIPSNNEYYLTSFCDASVACGYFSGNCYEYYSADYKRFGCNSIISCCQGTKCVNLKVIDGGPSCAVEQSAGMPVVDASYSTCQFFTGSTSCGYSYKILVTCIKHTSSTIHDTNDSSSNIYDPLDTTGKIPLGPCTYDEDYATETGLSICGPDAHLFEETTEFILQ